MSTKPPIPDNPFDGFPRIAVDTAEGSPFHEILRAGTFAADAWTLSASVGPRTVPMTAAEATRGQIRQALLHLLELGLIDIDTERLAAAEYLPVDRLDVDDPWLPGQAVAPGRRGAPPT